MGKEIAITGPLLDLEAEESTEFKIENERSVRQTIYGIQNKYWRTGLKFTTRKDSEKGLLIVTRVK